MKRDQDANRSLRKSWDENAQSWAQAVRQELIPSRSEVTNQAITDAVMQFSPKRVLDFGCGEGWLVRHLKEKGVAQVVGLDGGSELVDEAQNADPSGEYVVAYYEEINAQLSERLGGFDIVVCNFSIMGNDLKSVLRAAHGLLYPQGRLIIQTVCMPDTSIEGWREETFDGFGNLDWSTMPWFYHTRTTWLQALESVGFRNIELSQHGKDAGADPVSLILTAQKER